MKLWPHQQRAIEGIHDAMRRLVKRLLVTSPTGGGKTTIMLEIVKLGQPVAFYLHRRALLDQFRDRLDTAGIRHGVRASQVAARRHRPVQLCSIGTDYQRCIATNVWDLHEAKIVFIDEAHEQKGEMMTTVMNRYAERGAMLIGFTATPVNIGQEYDELIVAGNNTELRHCGALLPSTTYAPNEPNPLKLKPNAQGGYSEKAIETACSKIMPGNIFDHWKRLNPDARPAIGFACSVPTSLGHAEQFYKRGVGAAHIDGDDTWINGTWYRTDRSARRQLEAAMRSGEVKVVWNRFVLREGVDWTFLYHGIFATRFGSLQAYLQAGGRVLRNDPTLDHVIFQDHGGNWHAHGSLNSDRVWNLHDTSRLIHAKRVKRLREKKEPEPICCKICQTVREMGRACPECGHVSRVSSRFVQQTNGKLKETTGDIYKPRRHTKQPHHVETWERVYYRAKHARLTFEQALALFARENNWVYPSPSFPRMPRYEDDWFRRVADVDPSRLTMVKQPKPQEEPCLP